MRDPGPITSGYAEEMRRIEEDIAEIGEGVLSGPSDSAKITKYVYRRFQRAAIAQDSRDLAGVEPLIDRVIALVTNPADFYLLKAQLYSKLHRLSDARAALAAHPAVERCREAVLIRADCDFQQGRYEAAKRGYGDALEIEVTWDALARLAHFHAQMGDVSEVETLYAQAEDELTAKEMRSFAWLEIQRGLLDFQHGRFAEARAHYAAAEVAYPGYPLLDEHMAELLAAEGHYPEAIARFDRIETHVARPELHQARGELHAIMGEEEIARSWYRRALEAYSESVERGEVHYYHHLVDYYCDVAGRGPEAVRWALRDVELREYFATQSALGWAYFRDGQLARAVDWIDRALASGAVGAGLFFKAAAIYSASGRDALAAAYMERARSLDPRVGSFHIHH